MSSRKKRMKVFGITIPIFFIMWIALMVSSASAAKFPLSFSSTDNLSIGNLSIMPGNDTTTTSVCLAYPCASLESRSKNYVEISLSLFSSQIESPQPQTFYTDLVRIVNSGNTSQKVDSIFVQVTSGTSSLGALTVFYCSMPSKDPYDDTDCALVTLNETVSSGYLVGKNVFPASLTEGGVGYIGAAGFAEASAMVSDQISFQIGVNCGEASS